MHLLVVPAVLVMQVAAAGAAEAQLAVLAALVEALREARAQMLAVTEAASQLARQGLAAQVQPAVQVQLVVQVHQERQEPVAVASEQAWAEDRPDPWDVGAQAMLERLPPLLQAVQVLQVHQPRH